MREILFRGKQIDNGEWVYGNLINKIDPNKSLPVFWTSLIHDGALTAIEVIPETVGQFTGLTDKNGKKIFEGDVLQKWDVDYEKCEQLNYEYDEYPMRITKKDVATMDRFPCFWLKNESFGYEGEDLESPNEWEVISNIHDNPELLKGDEP